MDENQKLEEENLVKEESVLSQEYSESLSESHSESYSDFQMPSTSSGISSFGFEHRLFILPSNSSDESDNDEKDPLGLLIFVNIFFFCQFFNVLYLCII
jgi:hypothetical protein